MVFPSLTFMVDLLKKKKKKEAPFYYALRILKNFLSVWEILLCSQNTKKISECLGGEYQYSPI